MAKLLKRLRNLVLMECLLDASLQHYPLSLPELHNFVEHSGSPPARMPNHSIQREKRSSERMMSEGTSQDNKKRHKKDPLTSEKSNPNEKLRQPTIVDAFKRAGAVSQEIVNENSQGHSSGRVTSQGSKHQDIDSNEAGPIDISAEFKMLDAQRFKFRPLLVDCLQILCFSESPDSCCSDPAAELPLHLYLLRDFHNKLDYLNPPSKPFPASCQVKASSGYSRLKVCEFFGKIRLLFPSLKKHMDGALSILRDGSETCEEHWEAHSSSAGNPDVPYLFFSKASAASSVFREVLCCYSKMLSLPDLYLQTNIPILRDLLGAFQPIEKLDNFASGLNPAPVVGNIDYLYCGVYSFLEEVLETACSLSFLQASEVLFTLQSLVNSIAMLIEKSMEANGKNMQVGCFQRILPFLKCRLGVSAHRLLSHNSGVEDNEFGGKSKGEIIQKILQIYLKNSESTSDLLSELACSVLPQVPSCKTKDTQEAARGFPTLCPTMFLTWCRVLHEENLEILNKLVQGVLKKRGNVQIESVKDVLVKLCQSVNIVVSLVSMCKVHDKVAMHAMAVKYGGKFVDSFLKVFNFLQIHFQAHDEIILQIVKELQKATRIIQTLCSEAKGLKRTMVTSKIPATKRSMERFLFHVKALVHNTSSGCTFWMGNLKHKDLYGQVVSSQVYANGEVDVEARTEGDPGLDEEDGGAGQSDNAD